MRRAASAFELRGVVASFGDQRVLAQLDLCVAPGEVVALVGPSGAGKTTLLRLLVGAVRPSAGRVVVDGVDLATADRGALRRTRAHLGFVHQDLALVPNVRVAQNVIAGKLGRRGLVASLRSMVWPSRADLEEAHALLARVGIGDKLFQRTDTLSGGQQQRVAIARALFQEPSALLADEPLASVDPARARALLELLVALAAERDLTLVLSLHDVQLARELVPRCIGLREGRVVFDARTADVDAEAWRELYRLDGDRVR